MRSPVTQGYTLRPAVSHPADCKAPASAHRPLKDWKPISWALAYHPMFIDSSEANKADRQDLCAGLFALMKTIWTLIQYAHCAKIHAVEQCGHKAEKFRDS